MSDIDAQAFPYRVVASRLPSRGAGAGVAEAAVDEAALDSGWRVILFNCSCHSFDEVESQLQKAIRCTLSRARRISLEVHANGSSVVYTGALERCEAVADVLGSIGLLVHVAKAA